MKTVVVNLYAGPGAGKSVAAWTIAAELKKQNILTEYVPEYAKELVWDNNMWPAPDFSSRNRLRVLGTIS